MLIEEQLAHACCAQPFALLGRHQNESVHTLNVWMPDADKITVSKVGTKSVVCTLKNTSIKGLFTGQSKRLSSGIYQLNISRDGHTYSIIDPYQFQQEAYHAVHFIDHQPQNLYQQAGAQLITLEANKKQIKAVRFAVYAPNAAAVSVIGDFNQWDDRIHPLQKTELGYWVLVIPEVETGERYKFRIKDVNGNTLPHKSDPLGFHAEQYPSHASKIYDHTRYQWRDHKWMEATKRNHYHVPMSIYEVHLGSWKRPGNKDQQRYLTYRDLADDLVSYVKHMGYTHIELLPISEYPFDGSWGYQPVGMFAPTSRFGDPDDFKYFVDSCHQHEIGVIIDWVPAHFPEDGHGLARFDGTCVYEYADPRKGWHPDWNSCIYDFGKGHVRQFLVASAMYWFDKFHVDGIRVDAVASMLYLDYSRNEGEWIPNVDGGNQNYEAISLLRWMNEEVYKHFPHAMTIAEESTSFPKVSRPIYDGGLGFGFKWNMGWMHDSLHFISKDPAYRRYHHNDITFSMVYAFDENFVLPISHDEVVHGKGSLLNKMPGDEWQQAANLRCYAAFMYGHPGKKLNFMGNEIAQSREWNHDCSIDWHLLDYDKHKGVQTLYQRLNELYKTTPALYECDHEPGGFSWIDHQNHEQSVLSFVRKNANNTQKVYVICNFTPIPRQPFKLGVQDKGEYRLLLNSDDNQFWGSGQLVPDKLTAVSESWNHQQFSIDLALPPLATVFLVWDGTA